MRSQVIACAVLASALVLTVMCSRNVAADEGALTISSVAPQGMQADGRYHLLLHGTFDKPADVRPLVLCDGQLWPSAVHSATTSTLDISIPPHRGQPRCLFLAHRLTDGVYSAPSTTLDNSGQDQIAGSIDRGVNGTRHGMELYGHFPHWPTLNLSIACTQGGENLPEPGARALPYNPNLIINGRSLGQINVSFDDVPSLGMRCSFTPIDATGVATGPLWGPVTLSPYDTYSGISGFGAYHGSVTADVSADASNSLASGQRWLTRSGFDVTKIHMSPRTRLRAPAGSLDNRDNPYHINLDVLENECPSVPPPLQNAHQNASPAFLECAARSSMYQELFRIEALKTIVTTANDSASSGDYGNPWPVENRKTLSWYQQPGNTERVVAEYRGLALALYETQKWTGKRFIVGNWETDSELNACTETPGCDIGNLIEALTRWFLARKEGISQARAIAQARGLTGVFVDDAIEFNTPPSDSSHVYKAINHIIPHVMPRYMSYSAWPSTSGARGGVLDQDIIDIQYRFAANSPQLYLGELGQWWPNEPAASWDTFEGQNRAFILAEHARAAQRAQLPATILWTAYDNDQFMFYNSNGSERSIISKIRASLYEGLQEAQSAPSARIGGIHVRTYTRDGIVYDLFEMYIDAYYGQGRFPASLDGTTVRCSYTCSGSGQACTNPTLGGYESLTSVSRGEYQSNVSFRHRDPYHFQGRLQERWCTVKVPGSLTHGPKTVSPTPWRQP